VRRTLFTALFATVGLIVPLLAAIASNQLHAVPQFPAVAGEDDFSLRAAVFFLFVVPAFAVIGGWIGYACAADLPRAARAWFGVLAGTVVAFVGVRACARFIERIAHRETANLSAIAFLAAWSVLAAIGAWLALRAPLARRKRRLRDG
jgi:hypothetical protein